MSDDPKKFVLSGARRPHGEDPSRDPCYKIFFDVTDATDSKASPFGNGLG
jgi:hypothetical protein